MSAPAITPAVYVALLAAFQSGANERAAADAAGCTRAVARSALTGVYASRYAWAPSIRDVVAGLVPTPTMPRVWPPPAMPKLEPLKPEPRPKLAVVRKEPDAPAGEVEPLPPPPPRSDAVDTSDGLTALTEYRQSLTVRARAMAAAGKDLDRVVKWVASALVSFAESMSERGATVGIQDLTAMAQAIGLVATSMDKFGAALERAVAAEQKYKAPTDDTGKDDGFAEASRLAAERKRA